MTLRILLALPFYVVILLNLSLKPPPAQLTMKQWATLVILGITGYYFASFFNFLGLVYITASLERILLFIYPTFVLLLNTVNFHQRITRLQLVTLLLTYAGLLLAFWGNIEASSQNNIILGTFWVILSGLVYAIYLVGSDHMIALIGSQQYTYYAMLAATAPTILHCLSRMVVN